MGSEHCAPGLIASFSSTSPLAVQYQFQCQESNVGAGGRKPDSRIILLEWATSTCLAIGKPQRAFMADPKRNLRL